MKTIATILAVTAPLLVAMASPVLADSAEAANIAIYGNWSVMDIVGDEGTYSRTYIQSATDKSVGVAINFPSDSCDDPHVQVIATFDITADYIPISFMPWEKNMMFRIDKKPVMEWDEILVNSMQETGDTYTFSLYAPLGEELMDQILAGNTLRVKVEGYAANRFSLYGSTKAITDAYKRCLGRNSADDDYFPNIAPGESDDDYFNL
jgi:hypothetical protein